MAGEGAEAGQQGQGDGINGHGTDRSPRPLVPWRVQVWALACKSAVYERRRWRVNLNIVLVPLVVCVILYVLQRAINSQIVNDPLNKCGCKCLRCCEWVPTGGLYAAAPLLGGWHWECRDATDANPCSPFAECERHDESVCGISFSTPAQATFCAITHPPTWPALLPFPIPAYRDEKLSGPDGVVGQDPPGLPRDVAVLMHAGDDPELSARLAGNSLQRTFTGELVAAGLLDPGLSGASFPGLSSNSSSLSAFGSLSFDVAFAQDTLQLSRALSYVVLGTAADSSPTLLVEPGLLPDAQTTSASNHFLATQAQLPQPRPLYVVQEGTCAPVPTAAAIATPQAGFVSRECAGVALEPAGDGETISRQVYCGWLRSDCIFIAGSDPPKTVEVMKVPSSLNTRDRAPDLIREFPSALFDWRDTTTAPEPKLNVAIHVNNTQIQKIVDGQNYAGKVPYSVERWNRAINMATNALLQEVQPGSIIRLEGVRDFPKESTGLALDLSGLVGVLFYLWILQLLIPSCLYALVGEKERNLRVIMKLHGLRDSAYYTASYLWYLGLYGVYVTVFSVSGHLLGLSIFNKTQGTLLALTLFVWGNLMVAWSSFMAALAQNATSSVLAFLVWLFASAFVADSVLQHYMQEGPLWVSRLLELHPSFGLYRVLWEAAQYSFLGDYTNSFGLTFAKTRDPGCDYWYVIIVWVVEWAAFLALAWYIDQVSSMGTGAAKHPLFFLGFKRGDRGAAGTAGLKGWLARMRSGKGGAPSAGSAARQGGHLAALGAPMARVTSQGATAMGSAGSATPSDMTAISDSRVQRRSRRVDEERPPAKRQPAREPGHMILGGRRRTTYLTAEVLEAIERDLVTAEDGADRGPRFATVGPWRTPSSADMARIVRELREEVRRDPEALLGGRRASEAYSDVPLEDGNANGNANGNGNGSGNGNGNANGNNANGNGHSNARSSAALGIEGVSRSSVAAVEGSRGNARRSAGARKAQRAPSTASSKAGSMSLGSGAGHAMGPEPEDVLRERMRAELLHRLMQRAGPGATSASVVMAGLRKTYAVAGETRTAVEDLSLAINRNECFGLLGPNGAGKTTTIRCLEGFVEPTSGSVLVEGLSVITSMDRVHPLMGVCPQHDTLWPSLTAREHLSFYARIKGVTGNALRKAVEEALVDVNLLAEGAADRPCGQLSGGQRRRLSVAIALVGDPAVVYLDEPSSGLDPASRHMLWRSVERAKQRSTVVLTTHSMEEAEALCDRIGIMAHGRLRTVGTAPELTARHGAFLLLHMLVPETQSALAVDAVLRHVARDAKVVYELGGSLRFEVPVAACPLSHVFDTMQGMAKHGVQVLDWGVSNATLEDVFNDVAAAAVAEAAAEGGVGVGAV